MKLRSPSNQIFGKARIPAVQPIIPDVYKVRQDPITAAYDAHAFKKRLKADVAGIYVKFTSPTFRRSFDAN